MIQSRDILVCTLCFGMTITEIVIAIVSVFGPVYYALLVLCAVMSRVVIRRSDSDVHQWSCI